MKWLMQNAWRKTSLFAVLILVLVFTEPVLGCIINVPPRDQRAEPQASVSGPTVAAGAAQTQAPASNQDTYTVYLPMVVTPTPAFPGAEGFGAYATGGRGGRVIPVTNLNDSGAGSLRACVEAEGPRTCVFRVAGEIVLRNALRVTNPHITIAGQTAPEDGITLRNHPDNQSSTLSIRETHDVIVRYIRFRSGPSEEKTCCLRGLIVLDSQNVIVDHVSVSWATDVNLAVRRSQDVTVQWSIISEPLHNSTHIKGPHGMGAEIGGPRTDRVSFYHNLVAHADQRAPRLAGGLSDIRNNVIYNISGWPTVATNNDDPVTRFNYVGNYYQWGPESSTEYPVGFVERDGGLPGMGAFQADNAINGILQPAVQTGDAHYLRNNPYPVPEVITDTPIEAFDRVLADAGASKPIRDAVDERILTDVVNETGRVIDHPNEVGGWPALASSEAPPDTDADGMPDSWEESHGLDPNDPGDGAQEIDGDGYTNLEEYLNETDPRNR